MRSAAYAKQKLCLDFASLIHACPKGIYVAPVPDEPLLWTGVLFVRKGKLCPYANAVLRFEIDFPGNYPERPPLVTFLSDVFHPLVAPLTTYTYTTRDTGGVTVSAADRDRLPPGGLNVRHGFPEWFDTPKGAVSNKDAKPAHVDDEVYRIVSDPDREKTTRQPPLTVEILQYIRVVFDTEALLDSIPFEAAANTGAWQAWRSHRLRLLNSRSSPTINASGNGSGTAIERGTSPLQQAGGARRPGEWNWQGVWEDRVRKSIQASISEHTLYCEDNSDVLCFSKMDPDAPNQIASSMSSSGVT